MSIYLYKDNATELYVFKYNGFVFNPKPGSLMLIERESDGFVNLQAVYDNKAFRQNTNGHILNDFVDPELILDDTGTAYGTAASDILAALSDFFVDAPSGSGGGDIISLENTYAYGVIINLASSSPTLTRTGNLSLAQSLPVQSGIRACLLNDDGVVNYYLNPSNWAQKADGTASKLDGTDGQVVNEVPKHYMRFYPEGTTFRAMSSTYALPGYTEVKKYFVGVYEAALQRSNLKLASVKNTSADFRGGNNTSAWDAAANSLLGKPVTAISTTNARTYARNRKPATTEWNILPYHLRVDLIWLYFIEYANLNSQAAVSAKVNGYSAGGLGNGVTTANSTEWSTFNAYHPFISCGASDTLASGTGEVSVSVTDFGGAGVARAFTVPRWRGFENIFGHVWEMSDGILVDVKADADGGTSIAYSTSNPANFSSSSFASYDRIGSVARTSNWIRTMVLGEKGHLMAEATGGAGAGSTGYFCDYLYTSVTSSSLRTVFWGGDANFGAFAGLVYAATDRTPAGAAAWFGARLCFIPTS